MPHLLLLLALIAVPAHAAEPLTPTLVAIPAGSFDMGALQGGGDSDEHPPRLGVAVDALEVATTPVTVAQFRHFVAITGHITDAERGAGCTVRVSHGNEVAMKRVCVDGPVFDSASIDWAALASH